MGPAGSGSTIAVAMGTTQHLLIGGFIALLLVVVTWRLASRRRELPCPVWLRWMVELDNPFTRTNRAAVIVAQLGVQPGMVVADLGCGPGRLTVPLAQAVGTTGSVTAVDLQPGMLQRAQQRVAAAGLDNVSFIQTGLGAGKLGLARFDRAVLVTVLGEIPDQEAALREVFAALKPGGILSVTEVIFDPHFQTQATVRQRAAAVGLQEQACFGHRLAYTLHLRRPAP